MSSELTRCCPSSTLPARYLGLGLDFAAASAQNPGMSESKLNIYTIGHSNHPIDKFTGLLKQHEIALVVDTRSHPHSRFSPYFNRKALATTLAELQIGYEFLGDRLGGRPAGAEFYDSEGYVLYGKLAESTAFRDGLEMLKPLLGNRRVALLCSEENPSDCHRRLLIGHVLFGEGIDVLHIRRDGQVQSEQEMRSEEAGQSSLFEGSDAWKSPRSVIR